MSDGGRMRRGKAVKHLNVALLPFENINGGEHPQMFRGCLERKGDSFCNISNSRFTISFKMLKDRKPPPIRKRFQLFFQLSFLDSHENFTSQNYIILHCHLLLFARIRANEIVSPPSQKTTGASPWRLHGYRSTSVSIFLSSLNQRFDVWAWRASSFRAVMSTLNDRLLLRASDDM